MTQKLWLFLFLFASVAHAQEEVPTIILNQEEYEALKNAQEPYFYLGPNAPFILESFKNIKDKIGSKSKYSQNIEEVCELISKGHVIVPSTLLTKAVDDLCECLENNESMTDQQRYSILEQVEDYKNFIDENLDIARSHKKKFCNIVVQKKLTAGQLNVCGDAIIHGNEFVEGTLTTRNLVVTGEEIISGCLTAGCLISLSSITGNSLTINGPATISGCLTVSCLTVNNSAFIGGDLTVAGNITAGSVTTTSLELTGCLTVSCLTVNNSEFIGGNLTVAGNITASSITTTSLEVTGCLTASCLIAESSITGNSLIINGPATITGCLTVSCLTVINSASVGQDLSVTGTIFGTTLILTQTAIMQTASFTNFLPTYAPLTAAMQGSVRYFGDSIAIGSGLPSPTTQRWPALLSNFFGTTELNFAISGDMVNDSVQQIYVNDPPGTNSTTFQALGWNDVPYTADADTIWDELRRTTEAMVLFTTLPDSQKVNARNAAHSAGWANANPTFFGSWGLQTSTPGALIQATVVGRFVCFSMSANTNTIFWDIDIDGIKLPNETGLTPPQPFVRFSPNTQNHAGGPSYNAAVFVYDTGSSNTTPHTITITYNAASTAIGYLIWFGGFNLNNPNCNTTFVPSVGLPDYVYFGTIAPALNSGMERRRQTWSYIQRSLCRRLRTEYGLPVYFVDMSYPWTFGMMQADTYHPNPNGHNYMFNRAKNVVLFGEFNYLT